MEVEERKSRLRPRPGVAEGVAWGKSVGEVLRESDGNLEWDSRREG